MQRIVALIGLMALGLAPQVHADAKTDQRLADARQVFETFVDIREQTIPTWLMERAYGVVVVPRVIKGALIIGGRGGKGVFAVRNLDGSWSDPVFITLAGVNVGFQWGVQSTDVVLVLTWDIVDEVMSQLEAGGGWGATYVVPLPEPHPVN